MSEPTYTFDGLRGVGRVELSFVPDQRVYALFGANGVGKTKCLEALFQYHLLSNQDYRLFAVKSSYGSAISVAKTAIGPSGAFTEAYIDHLTFVLDSSPRPEFAAFSLPSVFLGAGERGHVSSEEIHSGLAVGTFEQRQGRYFESIASGMRDYFSSLGMHANLEQWFVTLAQSTNPYQKSNDNRKVEIDTLLRLLNKIDNRYDPEFMEIDGANHVSLKVSGVITELRHLSTGFTSLVKLLQAIISGYANFTNEVNLTHVKGNVFIDEIESHLHVEWQSKIVLLLKELFPNTTFFIATHSPIVLSQLSECEAYSLKRRGDVVESSIIKTPNKRILSDVMVDAMGINLNQLKVARLSSDSQRGVKERLRKLLLETQGEGGDA